MALHTSVWERDGARGSAPLTMSACKLVSNFIGEGVQHHEKVTHCVSLAVKGRKGCLVFQVNEKKTGK